MEIYQVTHLPPQIPALEKEATAEGFRFITRLTSEWHSGTNRFDAPGECLMAAYVDRQLVGIGGLSVDPFTHARTGRLRRVYVTPASHGQQVGRRLVRALLAHAALHFETVRLNTDTARGSAFYRCGFTLTEDAQATHIVRLRNLCPRQLSAKSSPWIRCELSPASGQMMGLATSDDRCDFTDVYSCLGGGCPRS